jgi:hypothetical protein
MTYRDNFPRDHRHRWEERPTVTPEFWRGLRNGMVFIACFVGFFWAIGWIAAEVVCR